MCSAYSRGRTQRDFWLRRIQFKQLIARYVDEEMLHLIAAQHLRGRRPFVVTTNIDAGWRVERAQAVDDLYDMATAAGFRPSLTGN